MEEIINRHSISSFHRLAASPARRAGLVLLAAAGPLLGASAAQRTTFQSTNAFRLDDPTQDVGDAYLIRGSRGVLLGARLTDQVPGEIYTMWWGIFNAPELCTTPNSCGLVDFGNPSAGLAIGYAGGGMVNASGVLEITGQLQAGEPMTRYPFAQFQPFIPALTETTMFDSRDAEVWVFLRSHGPAVPGLIDNALRTFYGGCAYDPWTAGTEPQFGEPGPNTCSDQYYVAFPAAGI